MLLREILFAAALLIGGATFTAGVADIAGRGLALMVGSVLAVAWVRLALATTADDDETEIEA